MYSQEDFKEVFEIEGRYFAEVSEKYVEANYDLALLYTLLSADCFHDAGNYDMYLRSILATVNMELLYKDFVFFEKKYDWFYTTLLSTYSVNEKLKATLLNTNMYYQKISGNYNEAINLAIQAIETLEDEPNNSYALAVYHNNLATLHFINNDFQRCSDELNLSFKYYRNSNKKLKTKLLPTIYFNIARNCINLNDEKCAKKYFDMSFSIIEDLGMPKKVVEMQNDYIAICVSNNYCKLANRIISEIDSNFLFNNIDSLNFYLNGIAVSNCLGISTKNELFTKCWELISKEEIEFQQELYALQLLQNKIQSLFIESKLNSNTISGIDKKVSLFFKNGNWNQNEKLDFLLTKLEFQKSIPDYDSSPDIRLARKYFNLVSKQIQSEESKFILGEKSRGLQQLLLSDFDVEKKYFEDYFEILEMNKSSVLFDQIYKDETQEDFIAEDLLLKEEKARRFLIFLEKELATSESKFESNKSEHDSLILNNLKLQISKASNEYDIIKHEIAEKYPEYNDYVLEESFFETSEIQASLKPDEVLLETVFSDDFCLLAFFSNSKVHTVKIEKEDYVKLETFLQQISTGSYREGKQTESLAEISKLFGLDTSNILDGKSRIIIVPDGPLYNLPFELLSRNGKKLLEDYSISYQYSYKLLMILKKHSESKKGHSPFLGVSFPTNEAIASSERVCDELELSKLSCAKNEIANIENILQLDNSKSDLTTNEFIYASKDARVIHIASHACPDEENHQLSRIHFKDDFLTNYDISAMRLNADLAVLSACETGYGKLIEGGGRHDNSQSILPGRCQYQYSKSLEG